MRGKFITVGSLLGFFLFCLLFFLTGSAGATQVKGASVSSTTDNYSQDTDVDVSDNSGGRVYGIFVERSSNPLIKLTINANVKGTATNPAGGSGAYGICSWDRAINQLIINQNGTISAIATGNYADAFGVVANSIGSFTNTGSISANATGGNAEAYGVPAESIGNFKNNGNIEVYVNSSSQNPSIDALALVVSNSNNATVINDGTMKVVLSLPKNADMTNVNATVFYIYGSNVTLSNYGYTWVESNVPGPNLRTLYITERSNVTLNDKFALTFGAPGVNPDTRPIYVGSNSKLNLNNTTLIARGDSRNLRLNEPYYLIENYGNVTGQWGGLERGYSNPDIQVAWYNATSLGENSAIIFSYVPTKTALSPVIGGMAGIPIITSAISAALLTYSPTSMTMISYNRQPIMLASAGVSEAGYIAPAYSKGIWLMPLYTRVNANDLGFDADSYGFALGGGGRFAPNFGVELYAGYLRNDLDFKVRGADSEDQDLYFGGFNLIYAPKPYFAKLMALGYYANHDYKGYTGLYYDLVEKADYNSYGLRFDLIGGYIIGNKTRIIPQVGVSYAYYNTDSFWTKVPDNPNLRRRYEPEDLNVWKVIAGLDVISDFETKGTTNVRVFGGLRLEQAITDNDISAITYAPNQPQYKLEKSIADTTGILQAGIILSFNKRLSLELSGKADLNADYQAYTGRAVLRYNF
jgi:hypothetical protein